MSDPHNLERFCSAQRSVYATALGELRAGRKRTHWMWFVFPQLAGLGHSATAAEFALRDLGEARAYLAHPLLGARLRECVAVLLGINGKTAGEVFGYPDNLKLRSCMTLFEAADGESGFAAVLEQYYAGERDPLTLQLLEGSGAR